MYFPIYTTNNVSKNPPEMLLSVRPRIPMILAQSGISLKFTTSKYKAHTQNATSANSMIKSEKSELLS